MSNIVLFDNASDFEKVAVNPRYVVHISPGPDDDLVTLTMRDGVEIYVTGPISEVVRQLNG